jgi:aminoglycoside 3-N-acetyltransferase I
MSASASFEVRSLGSGDAAVMREMLGVFSDAFGEPETYRGAQPSVEYLEALLASECFVAIAAEKDGVVIGGLAAYELRKFEQARSEFYIYDLAVSEGHRRQGIATALIGELGVIAKRRGAWVVFVQADLGDDPAIALYTKLGAREDVVHFDIPVE